MKNVLKLLSLFLVVSVAVSCDSNTSDDLGYGAQDERGWVYLMEDSPVITAFIGAESDIVLDMNLQVPNTSSDLTINYEMVSVSGADPNSVFSNSGQVVVPAGSTSFMGPDNITGLDYVFLSSLTLDMSDLEGVVLSEAMVFDVVLTGTSSSAITAGLEGETYKVAQRVIINPSLVSLNGTYTVLENFYDGVNAPSGLVDFFGESYQVELSVVATDPSAATMVAVNSAGFDTYFMDGVVIDFSMFPISFDDGFDPNIPVIALFREHTIETSSIDFVNGVIQCQGPLDVFGPYQFTLTKQ
jgi:hypothetical protein